MNTVYNNKNNNNKKEKLIPIQLGKENFELFCNYFTNII